MWWREPLLNFLVETRHKLLGPVEACSTFIWKVECILFLIEWLNWCCTLYFRPSVKSATFTCKWYSSVTHMGSSYLTWHFTSCKGNCCHGAIKKILHLHEKLIQDEKENSYWFQKRSEFCIVDRWDGLPRNWFWWLALLKTSCDKRFYLQCFHESNLETLINA